MAMFFNVNLRLFYIAESGLTKQEYSFLPGESKSVLPIVQLCLAPDGYFDVVYSKSFIKTAGICQSLLLDVNPIIFLYRLLTLYLPQNIINLSQSQSYVHLHTKTSNTRLGKL